MLIFDALYQINSLTDPKLNKRKAFAIEVYCNKTINFNFENWISLFMYHIMCWKFPDKWKV